MINTFPMGSCLEMKKQKVQLVQWLILVLICSVKKKNCVTQVA